MYGLVELPSRFQSTLPVWGATDLFALASAGRCISIHAPRVGSDTAHQSSPANSSGFQSTLPVWGATHRLGARLAHVHISIHAPRVGSDAQGCKSRFCAVYFNPRSPCGERHRISISCQRVFGISIHAPRVGSDRNIFYYSEPKTISCELRSQHDQLSGHLRTEYTRLFSQNRCEPATFP